MIVQIILTPFVFGFPPPLPALVAIHSPLENKSTTGQVQWYHALHHVQSQGPAVRVQPQAEARTQGEVAQETVPAGWGWNQPTVPPETAISGRAQRVACTLRGRGEKAFVTRA